MKLLLLSLLISTMLYGADCLAQTERKSSAAFFPAHFRTGEFSLIENISFPEGDEDTLVVVRCTAGIRRDGKLNNDHFFCFGGSDESLEYERNVFKAFQRSRLVPATLHDRHTNVVMKLSVAFERKNGNEKIAVYPNLLLNLEKFGAEYFSPQLIDKSAHRSARCDNLILRVTVNKLGDVTKAAYHQGDDSSRCIKLASAWVKTWKYIPGFFQGQPVEMDHLVTVKWRFSWFGN